MAVSRENRKLIESASFEALEDAWLSRLAEEPHDLDYFVGVARALAGNGEEERARLLLALLDDELRAEPAPQVRLDLLRRAGELAFGPGELHPEILSTLAEIYCDSSHFEDLVEKVGLRRAPDDLPKTWLKVDRLRQLLQFDLGAVVWMGDKGAGRVVEVNLELESFKIDFETHAGLRVGFAAAGKLLEPLPPGHVLRRKLEEPAALERLRDEEPAQLLRLALESTARPLAAAEIRKLLAGIVDEADWSSWWSAARRHPQVVSGGGRHTYTWAASGDDAREAVLEAFAAAAVLEKLEIFRRNAGRSEGLRSEMAAELAAAAEAAAARDPATALAIWSALEKAGALPADEPAWTPDRLLHSAADPAALLVSIGDRALKRRALERLPELRDDWPALFRRALAAETDPRVLTLLAAALREREPGLLEDFVDEVLARPRGRPAAFVWLLERLEEGEEDDLAGRDPLRLFQQLLAAPERREMAPYRARLRALFQGRCLPVLISRLGEEQAPRAEDALRRSHAEDYLRTPLFNALHLRFPSLRPDSEDRLYATREAIDARRVELKRLLESEIPANRRAIEEARALGDLRENFEYKAARQRHEYLTARAEALDRDLNRVRAIEPANSAATEVRIGSRVTLAGGDGARRVLTILGPWESDPDRDVLSYDSEIGRALLGLAVGDAIALGGAELEIEKIEPYRGSSG